MDEKRVEQLKMRQVEVIIKAIQNLGGLASYSQIYEEYEKITGALMTVGRKAGIRKTIEQNSVDSAVFSGNNIFYTPQKGSGMWGLTDEYKDYDTVFKPRSKEESKSVKKREPIKRASAKNLPKRAKTPEEKLYKKIYREFDKVKYIGDIPVNDEEYAYLIDYLRVKLLSLNSSFARVDDPIFAVALVQIGIREYNGRYWPHVSRITGTKLDGNKQSKIGGRFYNTLVAHDKLHLDENEMVNNILMHCFITKHYASDFFEFLFAYYQYDLDRDLEQHKDMRDHLLDCMKKAEDSPRAFRIKKGTADAATANEKGCKIRVYNILKWMDAYLFEDRLPENSPNRTAQFFVEWAKNSKRFTKEKNAYYSRGKKRFRYPYIHFDINNEEFKLVLPVQTVPLADNEESAELLWKISYRDITKTIDSETENTVVGCRNIDTEYLVIEPKDIFGKFKIELIKNETEAIKRFAIKADSARFFDSDYDYIPGTRLPEGNTFAFTKRDEALESDGYFDSDHYLGLDYYSLQLTKGNIVKKPDGRALSVGKELQEGLLEHNYVEGATVYDGEHRLPIYSKAPSILTKMKSSAQVGTMVVVNGEKKRLESDKCIIFKEDNSEYNYYLINLEDYCFRDDEYTVVIDVPSDRKNREYHFALIRDFDFIFLDAPYVFKSKGRIAFSDRLSSVSYNNNTGYDFDFEINSETSQLVFDVNNFKVYINVPVFKWKFNLQDDWHVEKPQELWHKDFPNFMYFVLPGNSGYIFSKQDLIDVENPEIAFAYDSDNGCFVCDTRKILTWLSMGVALHKLHIRFDDSDFVFLPVVTKSILANDSFKADKGAGELIITHVIIGLSEYALDVFCDGQKIAKKVCINGLSTRVPSNKFFGKFKLVYYELVDDDFGEDYLEFDRRKYNIVDNSNLEGKTVIINCIGQDFFSENNKSNITSSFLELKNNLIIKNIHRHEKGFVGSLSSNNNRDKIYIEIIDAEQHKARIKYHNWITDQWLEYYYDTKEKRLVGRIPSQEPSTAAKYRYRKIGNSYYYYYKIT